MIVSCILTKVDRRLDEWVDAHLVYAHDIEPDYEPEMTDKTTLIEKVSQYFIKRALEK
jgi:hypothetical protein